MAQYSIGEALSKLFEEAKWKPRMYEVQLQQAWPEIAGATIAKYTRDIRIKDTTLFLVTDIAALKNEIMLSKQDLISRVNAHFDARVITDVVVR